MLPILLFTNEVMMRKLIYLWLAIGFVPCMASNNFEMKIKVINSTGDTVKNKSLFGIKDGATNFIDKELGEFGIPSLSTPDNALACAYRFYEPSWEEKVLSYYDFRPDFVNDKDSIVYKLEIAGIIHEFKLEWGDFPVGIKYAELRSTYISDKYNYIDMLNQKSVEVKNPAVTEFTLVLKNYNPSNSVEESLDDVVIYPNPTSSIVKMNSGLNILKVEISDMFGNSYPITLNENIINIEKYPSGIYNLTIITDNKQVIRKKIIKI